MTAVPEAELLARLEPTYRQARIIGALWMAALAAFFAFGTLLASTEAGARMIGARGLSQLRWGLYLMLPWLAAAMAFWKKRGMATAPVQAGVKDLPSALSFLRIWTVTLAALGSFPVMDGGMLFMFGTSLRQEWRFVDLSVFGLAAAAAWVFFMPSRTAWLDALGQWDLTSS